MSRGARRVRARRRRHGLLAGGVAAAGVLAAAPGAHAASAPLLVTTTADDGAGSLRAAITAANAQAGADTITFGASVTGTITLASALPPITDALSITGPGAEQLTLHGVATDPVINQGSTSLELSGLTLTGGSYGVMDDRGTALELHDAVVTHNEPGEGFDGGGVAAFATGSAGSTLVMDHVQVTDNTGDYGGVYANNVATRIVDSTVAGNVSLAFPGGVFAYHGSLALDGATVSGNRSRTAAGGVATRGSDTQTTITDSTVAGNVGYYTGGLDLTGTATLQATTVTGNAGMEPGGSAGVYAVSGSGLSLESSVLAANSAGGVDRDLLTADGTAPAVVHSLVQAPATNLSLGGGAITGKDPLLGPLADNGGPTLTELPQPGSPLLDAGDAIGGASDQRGLARPYDDPAVANAVDGSDIGAVERQADATTGSPGGSGPAGPIGAAASPAAPPGLGGPVTPPPSATIPTVPKVTVLSRKALASGLQLRLRVPAAGTLKLSGAAVRPLTKRYTGPSTAKLTVRLSAEALKKLRRHHRLAVKLTIAFTPSGSSTTARTSASATLKSRRKAR